MMPALSELQDRSEVTNFNKESKLKHVETTEKNLLPTKEGTEIGSCCLLLLLLLLLLF